MSQIIFHGGCHGCTQQEDKGVKHCMRCRYFDYENTRHFPDLSNCPPSEAEIVREQLKAGTYHG